ncbi:MAG: hypothetical protein R3Y56_02550 [Akkermansia sp.]
MKSLSLLLVSLCALPTICGAMDLAKIDTTLTRRQADSLYEKAYQYRILSDMSVRREWVDEQHRLLLDFEIAKDSLLMAEVHYTTPVDIESAVEDAKTLNGGNLSKWQRAKDEQAKSIGLGSCYYSRTKDNRFFFIEADKNKKASCMIYFASSPRVNRRALEEANTESFTAMGTNATADAAKVLSEDEEARLLAFLKRTHQSRIVDTTTSTPSVAVAPRAGSSKVNVGPVASTTPAASPTQDTVAAADQPEAAEAEATKAGKTLGFNITEEQMYYILGGVIALIILIMMLKPKAPQVRKMSKPKVGPRRLR